MEVENGVKLLMRTINMKGVGPRSFFLKSFFFLHQMTANLLEVKLHTRGISICT